MIEIINLNKQFKTKGKNGGKIVSFHVISRVRLTFLFFLL